MHRRHVASPAALGLLLMTMLGAPVAQAGDPCLHDLTRPAPTTGSTAEVAIGECQFEPTVNHVATGSLVTWKNTSLQPHEVVGANLTWGAHDKLLGTGDSIGWTFDGPGVYAYTCMLHPGMTGAIVVGAVANAAPTADANVVPAASFTEPPTSDPGGNTPATALAVALVVGAIGAVGWAGLARRRSPAA